MRGAGLSSRQLSSFSSSLSVWWSSSSKIIPFRSSSSLLSSLHRVIVGGVAGKEEGSGIGINGRKGAYQRILV